MLSAAWRDQAACVGEDPERFFPAGSTGGGTAAHRRGKGDLRRLQGEPTVPRLRPAHRPTRRDLGPPDRGRAPQPAAQATVARHAGPRCRRPCSSSSASPPRRRRGLRPSGRRWAAEGRSADRAPISESVWLEGKGSSGRRDDKVIATWLDDVSVSLTAWVGTEQHDESGRGVLDRGGRRWKKPAAPIRLWVVNNDLAALKCLFGPKADRAARARGIG